MEVYFSLSLSYKSEWESELGMRGEGGKRKIVKGKMRQYWSFLFIDGLVNRSSEERKREDRSYVLPFTSLKTIHGIIFVFISILDSTSSQIKTSWTKTNPVAGFL